jgi:hypothetical protein
MKILPVCFLLFCSAIPFFVTAQKISGRVLNEGGKPASHVTVQFNNDPDRVKTNTDGRFTILVKKFPDTLLFTAAGYEPYKVIVTQETIKDSGFEVVLLSTRTKVAVTSGDIGSVKNSGNKNVNPGHTAIVPSASQKKLFMLDSMPLSSGGVMYKAGLLTAGELNDFNKWKMWEDFSQNEFKTYSDHWRLYPTQRYSVLVQNKEHMAIIGQPVFLLNKKTKDTVWSAITDNTGKVELWANMDGAKGERDFIISCEGAKDIISPIQFANGINIIELDIPCSASNTVDIAMAVDATGSMSDEIDFLKIELEEVIRHTFSSYPDLDVHAGSVFYRDKNDEYVVRHSKFQTDLVKVLNFIKLQRAAGGGDVPEAVDKALQTVMDSLQWSPVARSRILFLVTDAPPHDEAKDKIFQLIQKAAAKGIRIVPVACSGADRSTEFIMHSIAVATNGTYVFLTDNDGRSDMPHIKSTVDVINMQFFSSLLERIIKQMVFVNPCSDQKETDAFKNTPANIENIKITTSSQGAIVIESKNYLKGIFITDITGKILMRLESNEKQTKWTADLSSYSNGTYLVKYISSDDQWGAERFLLMR